MLKRAPLHFDQLRSLKNISYAYHRWNSTNLASSIQTCT